MLAEVRATPNGDKKSTNGAMPKAYHPKIVETAWWVVVRGDQECGSRRSRAGARGLSLHAWKGFRRGVHTWVHLLLSVCGVRLRKVCLWVGWQTHSHSSPV